MTAQSLAVAIVEHLAGWALSPSRTEACDGVAYLVREDGARIRVSVGGHREEGFATLRGLDPTYSDGSPFYSGRLPKIRCALSRSPASIAKDIARRLLPEYEPIYASAVAYVRESERGDAEALLVAERLAMRSGVRVSDRSRAELRRYGHVECIGTSLSFNRLLVRPPAHGESGARVSFRVHDIDPETAAAVLEIIAASERRTAERVRVSETRARVANDVEAEGADGEADGELALAAKVGT